MSNRRHPVSSETSRESSRPTQSGADYSSPPVHRFGPLWRVGTSETLLGVPIWQTSVVNRWLILPGETHCDPSSLRGINSFPCPGGLPYSALRALGRGCEWPWLNGEGMGGSITPPHHLVRLSPGSGLPGSGTDPLRHGVFSPGMDPGRPEHAAIDGLCRPNCRAALGG